MEIIRHLFGGAFVILDLPSWLLPKCRDRHERHLIPLLCISCPSVQTDEPNIYEGLRFYINCKIATFKETIIFEAI